MPEIFSILLLSNGHGEDIIGASLIKELNTRDQGLWIRVLPIVGEGTAYRNLPVRLLGPLKRLPSGGLMRLSLKNFLKDLRGGILGHTYDQIQVLRQIKNEIDMVICVGDVFPVILAGFFVKKPVIFIPTAKSEYLNGHFSIEKAIMKKYTKLVMPRDEKTAEVLREKKIPAIFLGNPMMDSFEITGKDFGVKETSKVVGILPGSRESVYAEIKMILKIVDHLESLKVDEMEYILSLAPQLSLDKLERAVNEVGWVINYVTELIERGVSALLISPKGIQIKVVKDYFGDILAESDIFIGLSGTANEQAVGIGKPLVTYEGVGPQAHHRFILGQKKLLGDSISIVEAVPEKIAAEVLVILHDKERYQKMSETGKMRMGSRGGINRMAEAIIREIKGGFSSNTPK